MNLNLDKHAPLPLTPRPLNAALGRHVLVIRGEIKIKNEAP